MFLLLRQSVGERGYIEKLHLSGPLYEGGTIQDVMHPSSGHRISFSFSSGVLCSEVSLSYDRAKNDPNSTRFLEPSRNTVLPPQLSGRYNIFAYLNAERVGPRVNYALPADEFPLAGLVGKHGEYTTALLARAKDEAVLNSAEPDSGLVVSDSELIELLTRGPRELDSMLLDEDIASSGGRLDILCNLVLGWVIPGAVFVANENPQSDSAALRFIRDKNNTKSEVRATHIGFGLSYTLPIIAAALSLRKNGILLVENPEAHLHPFSQSRIGAFLAIVAASGRQVFVETHSDHVVNGIRLAVSRRLIKNSHVAINFCRKVLEEDKSEVIQIHQDENGHLDKWPSGFFDQIENDLSRL